MTRRPGALACGFAAALLAAPAAKAWNNQGHMSTGAIAYDVLMRADPAVVRTVVRLAAFLPERRALERGAAGLTGSARDRMIFEYLARWPDDVRRGPFDHPDWHYAVRVVSPGWSLIPYTAGRARQAYVSSLATLEKSAAPLRDRAVAVAWILHLCGDMQQPLHAGNRLSLPDFPGTDRAGTIGYVRTRPGAPPRSLHDAWDSAADLPQPEADGAAALAAELEGPAPPPLGSVAEVRRDPDAAFQAWWRESYALARSVAYVGDALREAPEPARAPVLSRAYLAEARAVAGPRIRLGGVRGAQSLAAALDPKAP